MKRVRRDQERWRPPAPLMATAVFQCQRCQVILTPPLVLLADTSSLSRRAGTSLVPQGHYWPVPAGQDFVGTYAVALADLVGVGYHADIRRLIGCCGPSGTGGRNRVCGCGYEVGTERSDCIWPQAVYLDPLQVQERLPDAGPSAASDGGGTTALPNS